MNLLIKCLGVFLAGIALLTVIALLTALPIMWLWNWLCPELFGLPIIGFWQALGLSLLSGCLFRSSMKVGTNDT